MTTDRDRADRKGSTPIQIGSTKLSTDGSDNLSVTNASGTPKKLIASEIEIGDSSNKVIIKKGSDNKVAFQTQASGGSAQDSNAGGGVTVYANISAMTAVSASAGDQAFVTANSGLYVHNGGGWYKVATVNTSPTISSPSTGANITLATNGSATTIELVGADVDEGTTLQNSYAVTTGSLTNGGGATATITSSATSDGTYSSLAASTNTTNRFFKITPTTNTSHGGSFTLTFSMSDTISAATTVQNFSLTFVTTNGAYDFTTTSSRITIDSTDFNISSSTAFTFEFWYQFKTKVNGSYMLDLGTGNKFQLMPNTSSNILRLYQGGQGYMIDGASGVGMSDDTWYHCAITGDGSGNTKLYIDGSQTGSTHNGTWSITGGRIRINGYAGSGYTSSGNVIYYSDFRVVNGSIVYTSNFTRPSSPLTAITNTKLLTCQNSSGSLVDNSASSHSLTVVGTINPRAGVP